MCCVITQIGESSHDLLLSVTNRKALKLITLLPVTFSQLDPQLGVDWGKKVSTLIGYLLTDGLNCLTVKYLSCLTVKYITGWHLEKGLQF